MRQGVVHTIAELFDIYQMRSGSMNYIGTSGWKYDQWSGSFYPEEVTSEHALEFYASRLHTVEINNTFYQLPETETLHGWRESVPDDFTFAVKASRYITHMKKLKDPHEPLNNFLERIDVLGDKLGPLVFQLPGNWTFNAERLETFLQTLPDGYRCAFEFRDPSWHNAQAYEMLAQHNAAFCIYEFAGEVSPKETTADFVYIRLHGPEETPYEGQYPTQTLAGWAGAITAWNRQGKDVYCYFDNDQSGYAPHDAEHLQAMIQPENE
jgi:uncharacterized protein YecE (DUF72 family)